MGSPNIPRPRQAPPPADRFGQQVIGLQKAETDRRLRETRGRASAFLFDEPPRTPLRAPGLGANRNRQLGGRVPGSTNLLGL